MPTEVELRLIDKYGPEAGWSIETRFAKSTREERMVFALLRWLYDKTHNDKDFDHADAETYMKWGRFCAFFAPPVRATIEHYGLPLEDDHVLLAFFQKAIEEDRWGTFSTKYDQPSLGDQ